METSRRSGGIGSAISAALAWCGGAIPDIVDEYPEERTRLATIGATVLSTGLFAAASSGYAVSTVFGIGPWVPVLALLWGATIFNIDRLIVMTMHGGTLRRVITALPRLLLATVVAFIISRPLELWIFSPEISRGLMLSDADARKAANKEWSTAVTEADQRYRVAVAQAGVAAGVPVRQARLDAYTKNAHDCETEEKEAANVHKAEVDGTGGSKHEGDGPIAKVKYAHYLEVKRRCDADAMVAAAGRSSLDDAFQRQSEATKSHAAAREQDISKASALLQQKLDGIKATPAGSLLDRHKQLGHLADANGSVLWMTSFITAFFWLIEALPVLAKLMSGESIYDSVIKDRRDVALAVSRGAESALPEHEAAGRRAAELAAQVRRADREAAAKTRMAAMNLRYTVRQAVIDAARQKWQPSEEAVNAALRELERDALVTFEEKRETVEPRVSEPPRESHFRRKLIKGGLALGITTAAVIASFYVFRFVGPFARAPLNMALTVGCIVAALFQVKPVMAMVLRVTRTRLEEPE